jgi:hypothetical protein
LRAIEAATHWACVRSGGLSYRYEWRAPVTGSRPPLVGLSWSSEYLLDGASDRIGFFASSLVLARGPDL